MTYLEAMQATSADLYARYPRLVMIAFFLVAVIAAVWLFHFLFLTPPRTSEEASIPAPVNIQGNNINTMVVNIYQSGQLVPPTVVAASPSLPFATLSLVENGGFEQGIEGWGTGFFESYFASPGGMALRFNNAIARWYVDDQKTHTGGRALRIEQTSTYAPHVFSSFSQRIKVNAGQRYEVKYWAYLDATDGRGAFSLRIVPSRKTEPHEWDRFKRKIDPSLVGQWQEMRREFESGTDTFFDLRFAAETAMKLWIDDVSVSTVRQVKQP